MKTIIKRRLVLSCAIACAGIAQSDELVPDENGVIAVGNANNITITQTFADLPNQAVSLKKVGTGWTCLKPEGESTFSGGIVIDEGQLRVSGPQAIGTGPITIGSRGCSLILDGENTVVPGRVKFDRYQENSAWAASLNSLLTFTDIDGYAKLGRDAGRGTKLALVPRADSAALTNVVLNGAIDLALGGTITIGAETADALFDASLPNTTPNVHVATSGVTFVTAEGANAKLGVPLHVDASQRVVARYTPENFDFESDGWTLDNTTKVSEDTSGSAIADNESGYVKVNNAIVQEYCTTNGTHFLALRRACSASKTFTLEKDGAWQLVFDGSCRPANDYSLNLKVVASVDGVAVAETDVVTSNDKLYPWRRFASEPLKLAAGEHTVSFACTDNKYRNSGYFIDTVRLEQVESRGCVTVEGAGSLTIEQLMDPAEIKVSGGTLVLDPATVPAEAGLSVSSGARLTLSGSAVNLIVNGGFEDSGCETFTTGATNWTFTSSNSDRVSGHQKDGCAMTESGPTAPEGLFTAYLRDTSTMAQTVSVTESGVYRLSFQQACRKSHNSWHLETSVSVDGEVRLTVPSQDSAYDFAAHSVDVELTAGDHTIVFATDVGTGATADVTGNMVFLDAISLVRVLPVSDLTPVRISLVSGSVLRLEDGVSVVTENLFVNGEKFGGSASRLKRLGVVVEGTGTLKAKAGSGIVVLIH